MWQMSSWMPSLIYVAILHTRSALCTVSEVFISHSLQEKRGVTATYEAKCTTNELWAKFSNCSSIVTCAIFTAAKGKGVKTKTDKLMAWFWPSKTSKQGVSGHKFLIWKSLISCPHSSRKIDGVVWYRPLSLDTLRGLLTSLHFLGRKIGWVFHKLILRLVVSID